jgi:hypothetical protein
MPSLGKMMADYRAVGQQAEQALASLPQVLLQSFVPAAFSSLAIWQFRHANPGWLIVAGGAVTPIVAVIERVSRCASPQQPGVQREYAPRSSPPCSSPIRAS